MRWRLLLDGPAPGAANMARDEALYRSVAAGAAPPTVRLYTWSRPTLSLGRHQRLDEACDREACRREGVALVRRITGGRALLHGNELTYAVVAPWVGPFAGRSVRTTYAWIHRVFADALAALGVAVDPASPAGAPADPSALAGPCFAAPGPHETTVGARKILASAQTRSRRGFLQHGSLPLELDEALYRRVCRWPGRLRATDLRRLAPGATLEGCREAVAAAFVRAFGTPPTAPGRWTAEEDALAERLAATYGGEAWTERARVLTPPEPFAT